MKTETLLNIRPEVPKGSENSAVQTNSQEPGASNGIGDFKSALMNEIVQHKSKVAQISESSESEHHLEKDLPQDGKALPGEQDNNQSVTHIIEEIDTSLEVFNAEGEKTEHVLLPEQAKADAVILPEQAKADAVILPEQAKADAVILPEQAKTDAVILPEQAKADAVILPEQAKADAVILPEQAKANAVILPEQAKADAVILPEQAKVEQLNLPEQSKPEQPAIVQEVNQSANPQVPVNVLVNALSNALHHEQKKSADVLSKKEKFSELSTAQVKSYQSVPAQQLISEINLRNASGITSENKGEVAPGKIISDFQQYLELSRKQAQSGEIVAKVKNFDENMKASQENIRALISEFKTASNTVQNPQVNQNALHAILTERTQLNGNFTPLSNTLTTTQTLAAMEVKSSVGTPGWNQGFSNQIIMMANNSIQKAKIKLNPAHLGPIEVTVKIIGEAAVVNITSHHLMTKDAMESAIPRLKEMLNENGFSQVDVNVSHQDKNGQQGAALGSNNEHGHPTMPGEEQLSEDIQDSESDAIAEDSKEVDVNIVDYYA
ncbi:MAG: flagellar hook-length control protein FliK [gamma proteobacterium symbiont of Taylorina sp.]|nr:flagellar hook-length control protein FliK [gamma proteobacterium symbiont of Taylorina sp.]